MASRTQGVDENEGPLRRFALAGSVVGLATAAVLTAASWAGFQWGDQAVPLFFGLAVLGVPALVGAARERRWFPAEGPRWGERAMQTAFLYCVLNILVLVLITHPKPTRNPDPFIGRLFLAGWAYCYTFCLVWYWPRQRG
jgi:hypothetical protein